MRVLIKVNYEYRQVTSVQSDTTFTVDAPFQTNASGSAWSIVYGTGVIASAIANLSSLDNRIDVTSTNAVVPRFYCANSAGNISDFSGSNSTNGLAVVVTTSPGSRVSVIDKYKLLGPQNTSTQNAAFDFISGTNDGAAAYSLIDIPRMQSRVLPKLIFDYRYWFTSGGNNPALIKADANINATPSVSLYTNGVSDNLSTFLPAEFFGQRLRIRMRCYAVTNTSYIQIYSGATLGATTTVLGAFTITPANTWFEYDFCTYDPATISSSSNAITITKNSAIVYFDYITVEALDTNDFIFGVGTPEAAYTAPIGSMYRRTNGGANTTLYVKESGSSNTGWSAK